MFWEWKPKTDIGTNFCFHIKIKIEKFLYRNLFKHFQMIIIRIEYFRIFPASSFRFFKTKMYSLFCLIFLCFCVSKRWREINEWKRFNHQISSQKYRSPKSLSLEVRMKNKLKSKKTKTNKKNKKNWVLFWWMLCGCDDFFVCCGYCYYYYYYFCLCKGDKEIDQKILIDFSFYYWIQCVFPSATFYSRQHSVYKGNLYVCFICHY